MDRKKWAKWVLSLLLLFFIGSILLVVVVDPFQIYHLATVYIPPVSSETQSYANAGLARNAAFDSMIIGSSMTENFLPSRLDALFGGRFIKLSMNGGTPYTHSLVMNLAFQNHDIRRVIYCIDVDALTFFHRQLKEGVPEYLYDDSLFTDVYYWLNHSVLLKYIPESLETIGQSDPDLRDSMYFWGDLYPYGPEYAIGDRPVDGQEFQQEALPADGSMSQQTRLNVESNLIPFIQAHPETEFIFFYPPYSLVRWYTFYRYGTLDYHLSQSDAVAEVLCRYPNVRLFDFRACTEWILNLDNYIDDCHYSPAINMEMAERMQSGENQIMCREQSEENSRLIRNLVSQVVAAGQWPEEFDLSVEEEAAEIN